MSNKKVFSPAALLFALLCSVAAAQPVTVATDSTRSVREDGLNRDIKKVSVTNDGKNLSVTIGFSGAPVLHSHDRIIVMIDDTSLGGKAPTVYKDRLWKNPATYTKVDTSVDFYGAESPNWVNGMGSAWKKAHTWQKNADGNFVASVSDLTYTIDLNFISDGQRRAKANDVIRVVVFLSEYWEGRADPQDNGTNHVIDAAPANAVAVSTTRANSDTVVISFANALTIQGN